MTSQAIYEDCMRRNKNLSIAWIDYQKAFDNFPHSWVEKSKEMVGVNSKIIRFYKLSIEKWNTSPFLKTKLKIMQSQPIQIRRGIFQGDSLSLLITLLHSTHSINKRAEQS